MASPTIETTISIATRAHYGAVDDGGNPYILHPLRIMLKQPTIDGKLVALLHDIAEDTDITLHELADMGYSKTVLDALDAITLRPNEDYLSSYIERVDRNDLARSVKIADLEDNMDANRIPLMLNNHIDRLNNRYKPALQRLLNGKPKLVQIETETAKWEP